MLPRDSKVFLVRVLLKDKLNKKMDTKHDTVEKQQRKWAAQGLMGRNQLPQPQRLRKPNLTVWPRVQKIPEDTLWWFERK